MKELSIEEKARHYDKAIKRAKELLEIGVKDTRDKRVVLSFFPELKESEDEKMRKSIIYALRNGGFYDNDKTDEAIAWLEKQGQQKPVDNVEPKFHEGDWVVSKFDGKARRISEVHCDEYNKYYIVKENEYNIEEYDRLHRLWTIEDAKDGDVLDANGAPFIHKKHDKDCVYFYCGVNLAGEFIEANGIDTWNNNYKVYPATKEQRDKLEKAMLKAGYKWNADKKELIKL